MEKYLISEKYLVAMEKEREKKRVLFFKQCRERNGENIDLSKFEYKGIRKKGLCVCKICGCEWYDTPEQLYKRDKCPKCSEKDLYIKKREDSLLRNKERALKIYKDKNISNIEFFYNEKNVLMVKFVCHEKYCDGTEHGEQIQTGVYFQKGKGCSKCASHPSKAYTTEEWIRIAKNKFPEFDYNKSVYVNKQTKLTVTCQKHGDFEINPKEFLSGKLYCPHCTKERLHEEFVKRVIKRAQEVHKDDDYIYHPELIKNSYEKMGIECKKHGIFFQKIGNHINIGSKCPKCAEEILKEKLKQEKIDYQYIFIEQAKNVHGEKYIYDKVIYNGNEAKVIITCPEHGDFKQTPHSHLGGGGCPECAKIKISQKTRLTQEEFIEKVEYVHRNKGYDFSKTSYIRSEDKVIVTCPKHGDFSIKASSLMQGQGCPICRLPKLEVAVRNNLIENNLKHVMQKRFKKWLGGQSLDFYLPDYNIAIECQGLQHFKNDKMYQNLDIVKERDLRKKQLCKENNVHLIYYVPEIFAEYMEADDIFFTNVNDLIEYIKNFKIF